MARRAIPAPRRLNYEKALESDRYADRLIYQRMGATYSRFSRRLMRIEQ